MRLYNCLKDSIRPVSSRENKQAFKLASLKRLVTYIKPHWKSGVSGSILMLILSLLALPSPYLMKLIIDNILVAKSIKMLNIMIILLLGIQLIKLVLSVLTDYYLTIFGQETLVNIKKALYYRILRLPLSFFDRNQTGYLLSRIGEVEGLSLFFSGTIIKILISFLEFIFCLAILFYLNRRLTTVSLVILPTYFLAARFYYRGIRKLTRETYEKGATISRRIQDSLSGVDVIKSFTAERRETEKIHNCLEEFKTVSIKRSIINSVSSETLSLFGAVGGFLILWISGLDIIRGSFTVGSYIAFSAYIGKLYGPTQMFASIGMAFQPAIVALDRITDLMSLAGEEEKENGIRICGINNRIEFNNVSFSYDTKRVLSSVSFIINKGEKIVFAGPNGSGKSTIVKLMLGLYRAQSGSILFDSQDIEGISLSSLRERISIVSQNTFLFNDSIRNNILYSRPEATEKEIEEAIRLSGACDFIKNLERGLDTGVGERGVRISGGERQKISIARAILKNSDVVVFDEATAHLDKESEQKLANLIREKFSDKTCIIISHGISDLAAINKIYFLREGHIIKETWLEVTS